MTGVDVGFWLGAGGVAEVCAVMPGLLQSEVICVVSNYEETRLNTVDELNVNLMFF